MTERNRKAIISEDGASIEVYSEGKPYVIALSFSVWDWIGLVKKGRNLPKKKMTERKGRKENWEGGKSRRRQNKSDASVDMSPIWSLRKYRDLR
jgi:hypothetical protein